MLTFIILLIAAFKYTIIPAIVEYVRNLLKPHLRLFYVASSHILVFACCAVVGEYEWDLTAENMIFAAHELGV